MLAVAASSGCINSDKFTSGRLPYGAADGLAATAPRDPFLTGGTASQNEPRVAATTPTTQTSALANSASQFAAMPAGQMSTQQMLAPPVPAQQLPAQTLPQAYYLNSAESAGTPVTDVRQTAYTPSEANPFNASPAAAPMTPQMSPPMSPQNTPHPVPSDSAIEQVSYEMPVGMPGEAVYEENPFAEVQGQPIAADQRPLPQIQPMHGATDAWQPSPISSNNFAGDEFLPPQ
jgi:hypothetical protein